jgi:uncharacterized protein YciI
MKTLVSLYLVIITFQGFAQAKYSFVFLNKKADAVQLPKEEVDKIMQGHMDNINRLAKEGKLLVAGPFKGGGGIFILNTGNLDEARTWLSTDPGVQANRWNVEVLPYKPRIGGVCPVGENYEMTNYSFVRFIPVADKVTASSFADILKKHEAYVKGLATNGDVVTEGIFGDEEGGILIMKGELTQNVVDQDPGVLEGLVHADRKTLFIAKGSFCEK